MRFGPKAPDGADFVVAATACRIPLKVLEVPAKEIRDLYAADLVLVRPDQHVAWRGGAHPDGAKAIMSRVVSS